MKITPNVLASLVNGTTEGDGEVEITGFAKIEEATEGEVSFISNPKYAHYYGKTKASALLVNNDFEAPCEGGPVLIRVADPYVALAMLMTRFAPRREDKRGVEQPSYVSEGVEIPEDAYVGAFAYIGRGVILGPNVKIYPHAYVGDGVQIGRDTIVRSHVSIYEGCKIGERCLLHSGSVIGGDGFGFAPDNGVYRKIPQTGIVVIEDDVEIGANTTVDRATIGETRIGKGTKLDNLIQIAHNVRLGENNVIAAQTGIAGSTTIGDSNRIGGQVGFAGHIRFGSRCEVGAQSGVGKNYGDGARIIGYPAVDFASFAKLQVFCKRLPSLFSDVDELKKTNKH